MGLAYTVSNVTDASLRALNYGPQLDRLKTVPSALRRRGWAFRPLREVALDLGRTYAKVLQRIDCSPPHGDELLSQVDIFAGEPEGRRIRGDRMPFVEDLRIRRGDVLIAGAGQIGESTLFGRALVADSRLAGKLAAADIMVVRFEAPDSASALFTYAFLLSSAGLGGIRAAAYGTSIPRIRPDLLAQLPVPFPEQALQERVASLVRESMNQREAYLHELHSARAVIENLPEMQEARAMCAERKARTTFWSGRLRTLCAWNVASMGDALGELQNRWPLRMADVIDEGGIFYGPRFARVSCEPPHGVDFMSQRDLFLIRRLPRRIAHPGFSNAKLFVPRDTLLVGAQGTLGEGEVFGRTVLVRGQLESMAYTQHLLRIIPRAGYGAVLYAFLSTLVGMRLLRATGVGTKLLGMREDLLRELPVPDLTEERRTVVERRVEAAYGARAAADAAEAEAIRIVEQEVLPAWLA